MLWWWWYFIILQGPSPIANSPDTYHKIIEVALNLGQLYDHQTTVQDLLEEEGENATIETQALSVVISKTLQQTCSWVRTQCSFYTNTVTIWCIFSCKQCGVTSSTALLPLNLREQWLNYSSGVQPGLWEIRSVHSQMRVTVAQMCATGPSAI